MFDGGDEPQQSVPPEAGFAPRHRRGDDRAQDLGHIEPFRQIEPAFLQTGKPRAQVEARHLGQRHPEMREAVGVDGDAFAPLDLLLAQGAIDGRTHLPAVQHDRLIIEDAPLVEHVRVGADRVGSPPRIEPRRPEIARRFQAHHVGRGEQAAPPQAGDAMAGQAAEHSVVDGAQPILRLDPGHHLSDAVGLHRRRDAGEVGHREIGAEDEQCGIERHQFRLRPGRTPKQDPGEPDQAIDLDQHLRQLDIAGGR